MYRIGKYILVQSCLVYLMIGPSALFDKYDDFCFTQINYIMYNVQD